MTIKRIAPLQAAKIAGVLYTILCIPFVILFWLIALIGGPSASRPGLGPLVGGIMIIVLPIIYGVVGFLITLLSAWLYNVVAGMVGGLRLDVEIGASSEADSART